jgi:hypothetical protein
MTRKPSDKASITPLACTHLSRLYNRNHPAPHFDYGSLAILRPEPRRGGWQVLTAGHLAGVSIALDSFTVNMGD